MGANPYISTTMEDFEKMIFKYYLAPWSFNNFVTLGLVEWNGSKRTKEGKKDILSMFCKDMSEYITKNHDIATLDDLQKWEAFFIYISHKHGLVRSFKALNII